MSKYLVDGHFEDLDGNFYPSRYNDEYGNACERTPITHPYNYEGFVVWGHPNKKAHTNYSDRLWQWDYKKHNKLCEKHFGDEGQLWSNRDPKEIEAFLRDYHDKPELKLVMVMNYCNQASGYPVWRFDFVLPNE